MNDKNILGGEITVDLGAARDGIERLVADLLGLDTIEAASGIVAVTEAKMAATLEELTIGKGPDPRQFVLLAFGGGGIPRRDGTGCTPAIVKGCRSAFSCDLLGMGNAARSRLAST